LARFSGRIDGDADNGYMACAKIGQPALETP